MTFTPEDDFHFIRLVEPPVIALHPADALSLAVHDDGSVTIMSGGGADPAEAVNITAWNVACLARTLRALCEARGEVV